LIKIRTLSEQIGEELGEQTFCLSSYVSEQNKVLPCYDITRDGFTLLAMGFTGKEALQWKIKYMQAFNKMEAMLSGEKSVMQSLNEALRLMEDDKKVASVCGKGLAQWKATRVEHIERVTSLHKEAQMLLGFTS
jgi:Rha family phage regulatory protein